MAKEKVQEEIDILSQKGVNVTVIEQQTKITEDKIAELDKRLEDLPNVREELVEKYREQKEMQLKGINLKSCVQIEISFRFLQ